VLVLFTKIGEVYFSSIKFTGHFLDMQMLLTLPTSKPVCSNHYDINILCKKMLLVLIGLLWRHVVVGRTYYSESGQVCLFIMDRDWMLLMTCRQSMYNDK